VTALRIHNTLSRSPHSISAPSSAPLSFYTCGPTVYDDAHIGNFRSFLNADILRRKESVRSRFRLNHGIQ
jgi:cysteinyl-tRNA synthetase